MAGFSASIKLNAAKALLRVNNMCYQIARELFTMTVKLSPSPTNPGPYAAGLLANQWYTYNGDTFSGEVGEATSPTGEASLDRIRGLHGLVFDGKDGVVTLVNNLPYAYRAEVLGWPSSDNPRWKGAKPYAMVAQSIQAIAAKYK